MANDGFLAYYYTTRLSSIDIMDKTRISTLISTKLDLILKTDILKHIKVNSELNQAATLAYLIHI